MGVDLESNVSSPLGAEAGESTQLLVHGMTCGNCARHVTEALQTVPGVDRAAVNLESGQATVTGRPGILLDEAALFRAVREAGYEPEPVQTRKPTHPWSPLRGWQFNVVVGTLLTLPLFICEWVLRVGTERWYHWFAFALVLPIQTVCGARFYRGAWNQLKIGSSNMDTLVVLGSTTAFVYSTWGLFSGVGGHLFFMESASIVTLISIGHWFEAKVSARAASSLRSLLDLAPPTARWLDPAGKEIQVPVAQLKRGDQVVIKPGDRVPIDGEVLEGASAVNEGMLTGESTPVSKSPGSALYGGTSNLDGRLLARVTAIGEATALAQIIAVVQRAQTSRAEIQRLGDRVSSVFVPVVIAIAIATGLWWGLAPGSAATVSHWLEPWLWTVHHPASALAAAVYHAAAVLIIACPCAMGLATPVAIMAAANVASERGLLIRDGAALEKAGRITAILFDKTGTITQGQIGLLESEDYLGAEGQAIGLHKIAASVAKPSLHPLSQAIAALSQTPLATRAWREARGSGVECRLEIGDPLLRDALIRLGSLAWLRESGVNIKPGEDFVQRCTGIGATVVGIAADAKLIGLIALRDTVKEHARDVVQRLVHEGKTIYMVTGDNKLTAHAIAEQVGIPAANVFAEVRPEAKADLVKRLQARGERVAFVGDGINDAPALEQADLGIAVARASDVAREAADLILLNSDIQAVPQALALAQAALRTIKQNLFWAFFYNALGVPLAALGFLSPVVSAFAMGASDLVVIGNALRLRRWKGRAANQGR